MDNDALTSAIFWVVTTSSAILLAIIGFLIRYLFIDIRVSLKSVTESLTNVVRSIGVYDEKLTHQREVVSLLRDDFRNHVEHILKEYESVSEEIEILKDKQNDLQQDLKLMLQAFKQCQENCTLLRRQEGR